MSKIVKKFELNDIEIDCVHAVLSYMHAPGIEFMDEDEGYEILSILKYNILRKRGYKQGLGECPDWERNDWESIIIFYDEKDEKRERQILEKTKKKLDGQPLKLVERNSRNCKNQPLEM